MRSAAAVVHAPAAAGDGTPFGVEQGLEVGPALTGEGAYGELHGETAPVSGAANRVSRLGTGDLVYLVVLARVLGHLDADLLPLAGFGDRLVLDLHGVDALAKVARVSEDADRVADAQGSRFEPYRRDRKVTVIVSHETHPLFARQRAARGDRRDCRRPRLGRRACCGLFLRRRAAPRRLPRRGLLLERFRLLAHHRLCGG